jgi:hypothetical protein
MSRALILDRRAVMGTEICRSLARKGCAVDVLAEASSPAFYSRFCARRFPTPPCESGEPFRNAVREVVRDTRYDAIFVCNEEVLGMRESPYHEPFFQSKKANYPRSHPNSGTH